ncbi:DUF4199 domain-containing protein [Christiangramia fulva]|uniref:DUF4199 domain-containing protein n=1 Tax=Christiangramia fulva TaxID=2126553 RepID=A0A2R3Z632_9FLAO|nr:DUF4199 domain-containing protein [Christiangramia fulva]AVR45720.1 DUF4199 domain-containing protein [Christiangramia fulva]
MKKFAIEIKWGIIFSIVSLLWVYMEKALGWHDELIEKQAIYTNLFAIVAIIIYVLALLDKRKNFFQGKMTWTKGFISGVILSVVVAILSPITQYISMELISPDFFAHMISYTVETGRMTQEVAEGYFNLKSYMIQSFFFAMAVGTVTSAIVALIIRRK